MNWEEFKMNFVELFRKCRWEELEAMPPITMFNIKTSKQEKKKGVK